MEDWYLVERTCKCGCGSTFRVLPSSESYYAAITHDPYSQGLKFGFSRVKKFGTKEERQEFCEDDDEALRARYELD